MAQSDRKDRVQSPLKLDQRPERCEVIRNRKNMFAEPTTTLETHLDPNSTPEALAKSYDDWSGSYDELVKKGFTNIDAVDGSQKMLDLAEKKQIYRRLICDFVGPNPLDIEKDTYDAIVCCGGFAAGHLKEDCLPELIRVVKPGGYIVITFREEWLHLYEDFKDKLEPAMARLQEQGLWERVSREIFPNFLPGKNGITIVYKVL
ncbi:WBSCR27 [Branchiostoma lanceolatum]|uniref:WBSCR27 protein n=1 Tax=Branchiostoma lanceolatum TaxID=7740 RepID=A0A8K0A7S1_BRALA|nr:WBSCR27 [Branchiostoma lanceolatum]